MPFPVSKPFKIRIMYHVVLSKDGQPVNDNVFESFRDAQDDFNRQARNAWRRKSAWLQVQYCMANKMSWHEKGGHFYLELK